MESTEQESAVGQTPITENMNINPSMNFFSIPPLSTAEEGSYLMKVTPVTSIENNINISYEFDVDSQQYLDLHNSYHFVSVKIVDADGANLTSPVPNPATDDDKVAFSNNIASTIFEDCQLSLNGNLIESSNNLYPYKSYFQNFLCAGKDIKDNQLAISGYFEDTGAIDANAIRTAMSTAACANKGLKKRFNLTAASATAHFVAPLFLDTCGQKKYLQNGTNVKLKFTRSGNKFALLANDPAKNFQFSITEAYILVRMVKPSRSLRLAVEETIATSPAQYPMRTYEMRYFTFNGNSTTLVEPSLFTGPLPVRVVFGLVETTALDGNYTKSPFNFKHFNVCDVNLKMNGKCITNDPLRINVGDNDYLQPFVWMYRSTGGLFGNREPTVSYSDYKEGNFIYSFDLIQDNDESSDTAFHQPKDGILSLDIRFTQAPDTPISLVAMFEKENILSCDHNRQYKMLG